jgi:hypothetical protein
LAELPDLKPLASYPMLYIMGFGYVLLLGVITFLTTSRADYMNRERVELIQLLEKCVSEKAKP